MLGLGKVFGKNSKEEEADTGKPESESRFSWKKAGILTAAFFVVAGGFGIPWISENMNFDINGTWLLAATAGIFVATSGLMSLVGPLSLGFIGAFAAEVVIGNGLVHNNEAFRVFANNLSPYINDFVRFLHIDDGINVVNGMFPERNAVIDQAGQAVSNPALMM